MSNKQFFNNLSATYADVRKLDVKKINLKGKNILEYIKENTTIILDERGTNADDELDIWNSYVTKDENGNVIINRDAKPFEHTKNTISSTQSTTIKSAVKVIDNEVLDANNLHLMYWQTDGLTDGSDLYFYNNAFSEFKSDLSNLTNGHSMFYYCTNLTSFDSDLSSLTDGEFMFLNCTKLTTFNSDLSSLTNGNQMFINCNKLTSFKSDLHNLTDGSSMFKSCTALTSFESDLSNLTNGEGMFNYCEKLSEFFSDLPNLTKGGNMFYTCSNLTSFSSNLSKLTIGSSMFNCCSNLTSFTSDLSSLKEGGSMFHSCSNLTTFSSDLSSLTDGWSMFEGCSQLISFNSNLSKMTTGNNMFLYCHKLESFLSDLSSLTHGDNMFSNCKLDAQSVANIIHFIPQRDTKPTSTTSDGNISIGIGITNTDAAKQAFAEECDCDNWAELNKEFDDKNWAVQWQFNGEATTYGLRDPRPSTAVYTKLEEVFMPTDEEITAAKEKGERIEIPHYEYTSQDGDNYYNIHWYHDSNTNNEGYDYFESLEMATLAYSVIPKE